MLGKKAPGATSGPLGKESISQNDLPGRKKPDLKPTKSAPSKKLPTTKPLSMSTHSVGSSEKLSPSPGLKSPIERTPVQKSVKKSVKKSVPSQDVEPEETNVENEEEVPSEASAEDASPVNLVDNEQDEELEQRKDVVGDAKASGSTEKSYFQRGKDAATGLASFARTANKAYSQLPVSVQQQVKSRVQTGVGKVRETTRFASDGAGNETREVTEITDAAPDLPADLSALAGLSVGEDGNVLDDNGKEVGQLVEGEAEDLAGYTIGENGEILDDDGDLVGRVELLGDQNEQSDALPEIEGAFGVEDLANLPVTKLGAVKDQSGRVVGRLIEGDAEDLVGSTVNDKGEILDDGGDLIGRVEPVSVDDIGEDLGEGKESQGVSLPGLSILKDKIINEEGEIRDEDGGLVGQIKEVQEGKSLVGKVPNEQGQVLDEDGETIGLVEVVFGASAEKAMRRLGDESEKTEAPDTSILNGLQVDDTGQIVDQSGTAFGVLDSGELSEVTGMSVNDKGLILDDDGNIVGKARPLDEEAIEKSKAAKDTDEALSPLSELEGLKCNKFGKIVNESGKPIGELFEGDPRKLARSGAQLDDQGRFWDDRGNVIGKVHTLPTEEEGGPFADFEEPFVTGEGDIHDTYGQKVGILVEGEIRKVLGRAVDDDGDILDKNGNILGRAEPWEEPEPESEPEPEAVDLSELEGLNVNKIGNVTGPDGIPIARLSEGDPKAVRGRKIDAYGQIWGDDGEVLGRVTLIPEEERENLTPFGDYHDLVVRKNGHVEDEDGNIVGRIIEGDPQKLQGRAVDEDGDIVDKRGNVEGRAEPYTPPEEDEQEEEESLSILEGMKVNKMGNIVDENGSVWGRITSGNPKKLAGKQVDAEGQIWSDDGHILSLAELVPASEREEAEGIFYGLEGLVVTKDGTIVDSTDQVVGRLVEGDLVRLKGRAVDEDGEIIDKVGNIIGRSERWTPEEIPRDVSPMSGRKVTREGEIRDEDGNLIGRLTEGNLKALVGKAVDDNGYIMDNDGNKIGECTLLENIPDEPEEVEELEEPEEPALSAEEIEQQEKEEHERDLAKKMSAIVQQTLDSVEPLCKQITEHIERADRTPREELDEEQLVKTVKPLIEDAGNMLQECKGALRALDPDGQIAASAKARSVSHEATSEEYQLADLLKQLSQTISTTIDNGRKRIADMPHAKKKLNPLWSLLSEPLFQIIAAVGLLLSGVVGLLGNLLNGLGLGGLVRGLFGGLGIDNLLGGLGLK
ncbi:hypothetical protein N7466_007349 [Penicillium verhagenii]|uniref:uncharacterized protein n=1 Tax=Penicillium verhagenii TaxID=1562060 RepID=UPI0025454D3F|nr:uncharacterized protein N7466_007349 [Penicillium verhagenii]KAJ5928393.1 hypothetical protein N7466_007349 [Penicillium verhagenii]